MYNCVPCNKLLIPVSQCLYVSYTCQFTVLYYSWFKSQKLQHIWSARLHSVLLMVDEDSLMRSKDWSLVTGLYILHHTIDKSNNSFTTDCCCIQEPCFNDEICRGEPVACWRVPKLVSDENLAQCYYAIPIA